MMDNIKTILLTGATGYIGSNLAQKLVELNYKVIVITRSTSSLSSLQNIINQIQNYIYDDNYDSIEKIFQENKVDAVCHLASDAVYNCPPSNISNLIDSNIKFGTYILEAMSNYSCYNLINTGTYWQHHHSSKDHPICLYAATKKAFEDIIKYYVFAKNISAISLLLFDVYGPGDSRKKIFTLLQEASLQDKVLDMSEGKQKINMIYIDDVIEAYMMAFKIITKKNFVKKHNKYYISGPDTINLKALVEKYIKILGHKIKINWGALPYRDTQIMKPYLGKTIPGFKPKVDLEKGIKILINKDLVAS